MVSVIPVVRVVPAVGPPAPREPSVFVSTAWLLLFILRDTSVSVVISWIMTFGMSYGSVITSFSVSKQSAKDFAVSALVTSKFLNWVFVIATHTTLALQNSRVRSLPPQRRLSALGCGLATTRKSAPVFLASNIGVLVLGVAVYHVTPKVRHSKIHVYVDQLFMYVDIIAVTVAAFSTVEEHLGDTQLNARRKPICGSHRPRRDMTRYVKLFLLLTPILLAAHVAGVYAHFAGTLPLRSRLDMSLFALSSMVLKALMQELIRFYVLRCRVYSARIMVVVIGIPTIAIDTQMRIALLRVHNSSSQVSGTFAMAVIELLVRWAKTKLVYRHIRRQEHARGLRKAQAGISQRTADLVRRLSSRTNAPFGKAIEVAATLESPERQRSRSASLVEFDFWKDRLLRHHAAEVYVDMLSEYVAMGCAYAVVVIFWEHPMYFLGIEAGEKLSSGTGLERLSVAQLQLSLVGLQLVVEVVVDYVSSTLAAANGVNLVQMQRHGFFIPVYLSWAAVGNVLVAANMLLRDESS
jgi:hypothetical protein